jgi:hypothetical protein
VRQHRILSDLVQRVVKELNVPLGNVAAASSVLARG